MKILLTTTSFQDTPGEHHELLNSTGYHVDKLRGPVSEDVLLPIIENYDGVICGDDEFSYDVIEKGKNNNLDLNYMKLNNVLEYNEKFKCIIIPSLHPDFSIIISSISLIVTEEGNSLSHLAIIARERDIPIIQIKGIFNKIKKCS